MVLKYIYTFYATTILTNKKVQIIVEPIHLMGST